MAKRKSMRVGGGGRFSKLKSELSERGVKDPGALAASIGRAKYGKARFSKMGAAGKRRAKR
jgi:hypothetical protein